MNLMGCTYVHSGHKRTFGITHSFACTMAAIGRYNDHMQSEPNFLCRSLCIALFCSNKAHASLNTHPVRPSSLSSLTWRDRGTAPRALGLARPASKESMRAAEGSQPPLWMACRVIGGRA